MYSVNLFMGYDYEVVTSKFCHFITVLQYDYYRRLLFNKHTVNIHHKLRPSPRKFLQVILEQNFDKSDGILGAQWISGWISMTKKKIDNNVV